MSITAAQVKGLRDRTGVSMMGCKKALEESGGDEEKAIEILRKKGEAKAATKAGRETSEGLVVTKTEGGKAVIVCQYCETDFVAKNDNFVNLVNKIGDALLASNAMCEECALDVLVDGKPLKEFLLGESSMIGEKLSFRRFEVVAKEDNQEFGLYMHMGGKISSLTVLNDSDFETAKDVAMHVAAQNPRFLSKEDISEEELKHETEILTNTALNENAEAAKPKPEAIIQKMVVGRLNKNLKAICLLNQEFVKNPDLSVEQYVKSKGASIVSFKRLAVGEGIEKKVDNFVEEVMNQSR